MPCPGPEGFMTLDGIVHQLQHICCSLTAGHSCSKKPLSENRAINPAGGIPNWMSGCSRPNAPSPYLVVPTYRAAIPIGFKGSE